MNVKLVAWLIIIGMVVSILAVALSTVLTP
jgi:hypothetical protein